MPTTGHCLCGDIAYAFEGKPKWVAHCHCESCRRHTSSALATFLCVDALAFRYTHGTPAKYPSSAGATRSFCPRCGSPVCFEGQKWPGEIHLYIGTLSEPAAFAPTAHVNTVEQLPWFHVNDALKHYAGMGKSG